jgi:hypothetical protein
MKKVSVYTLLCAIFLITGCNNNKNNAAEYSNKIVQQHILIELGMLNISSLEFSQRQTEIDSAFNEFKVTLDEGIKFLENLGDFNGDNSLKIKIIAFYKFYRKAIDNELKEFFYLLLKDSEKTSEDIKRQSQIIEDFTKREKVLKQECVNAQKQFAKKNNFEIVDDFSKH